MRDSRLQYNLEIARSRAKPLVPLRRCAVNVTNWHKRKLVKCIQIVVDKSYQSLRYDDQGAKL